MAMAETKSEMKMTKAQKIANAIAAGAIKRHGEGDDPGLAVERRRGTRSAAARHERMELLSRLPGHQRQRSDVSRPAVDQLLSGLHGKENPSGDESRRGLHAGVRRPVGQQLRSLCDEGVSGQSLGSPRSACDDRGPRRQDARGGSRPIRRMAIPTSCGLARHSRTSWRRRRPE
jgi:hypothetical protein